MILHLNDEIQACGSFFNWHELLVTHQNTPVPVQPDFIVSPGWLLQ